ncbi:DNA polymerase alpha catalytic subunit (pol1) [Vairimorpha necatrix]|uniref:DNA polymerase n=1 Tax=Vairimorpha necatrix TaxID=6039 RepID=A0AAX4JC34_9MICR
MYFYCYNLQSFLPNTIYLYGRKLETDSEKDLDNIETLKSTQLKLTVDLVDSPLLAVYNNNKEISCLKQDLINYYGTMKFIEEDKLVNIFYDDLGREISVLRFLPEKKSNLNFKSEFCSKIFYEFLNPLETALISKDIKLPCVLKIKGNKTYIKFTDLEKRIKCNMPRLNYASISIKMENYEIINFVICINGIKYYSGKSQNMKNERPKSKDKINKENDIKQEQIIFKDNNDLINKIKDIISMEQIDCLIYFNNLGPLKLEFPKQIICDMFQYATANIKSRDFSILELCKYFKLPYEHTTDLFIISKILYDLFIKSNALILSKELSELSGYTINKVLNNNRAEIIEYALLHELYNNKYLLPPETTNKSEKYLGGLVLDPETGVYDELVLLLDFNSLYPSIIQEYNVCFSNPEIFRKLNSTTYKYDSITDTTTIYDDKQDAIDKSMGILPKILSNLIKRRKEVKKLMKSNTHSNIYNIRQLALKILANSIYGSLGYPNSRFCNYNMASFITEKGREILQDTKKSIEEDLKYKVIYGDTDSIMINTGLKCTEENINKAKGISNKVIELINGKYKNVEIELEKIFVKLLIYKKKKYIGRYINIKDTSPDMKDALFNSEKSDYNKDALNSNYDNSGLSYYNNSALSIEKIALNSKYNKDALSNDNSQNDRFNTPLDSLYDIKEEYKGTDSVKRNFCQASVDILNKVNKILLGTDKSDLYKVLKEEFELLKHRDKKDFIIHNMLNKPLSHYASNVPLPFIHLCKRLKEKGIIYKTHDMISYIIGESDKEKDFYKRAFLPTEKCKVDINYYINNQILPPLLRALSISHYSIERIYRIFNIEYKKTHSQKILQIKTECCQYTQNPSITCGQCGNKLEEGVYLRNIREVICVEIERKFSLCFECEDCKLQFEGYFDNCLYCMSELKFKPKNEEFDTFLEYLVGKFTSLGYFEVVKYVKMHLDNSEFRMYDISQYFT